MTSEVQPCNASIKNRITENTLRITMITYPKGGKNTKLLPLFLEFLSLLHTKLNVSQTSFTDSVVKKKLDGFVPLKQATRYESLF